MENIQIAGVDLLDARTRLVDDTPFLVSLLREFVRHSIAVELSLSIDGAGVDVQDALRKMHQIRGGAANLAARGVESAASRLESALRNKSLRPPVESSVLLALSEMRKDLRTELHSLRDSLVHASVGDGSLGAPGVVESVPPPLQETPREEPERAVAKVLIVDDSSPMRSYLRSTLEKYPEKLQLVEAHDGLEAFQLLVSEAPDLVICDLQMPDADGLKFLALRRSRPEVKETPVIMLTAEHDAERKLQVLKQGASDYITKPFHGGELVARVGIHLAMRRLHKEVQHLRVLLDDFNPFDELTGLYNRRHFQNLLLDEVQRTTRYSIPLSLILLDVDDSSRIQRAHGVGMLNKILSDTGLLLADSIRTTDKGGRIGTERFAVLLPHTGRRGALEAAQRFQLGFSKLPHVLDGSRVEATCSSGVTSSEGSPVSARDMMEQAAEALSEAKHQGNNRVLAWTPSIRARSSARRQP